MSGERSEAGEHRRTQENDNVSDDQKRDLHYLFLFITNDLFP